MATITEIKRNEIGKYAQITIAGNRLQKRYPSPARLGPAEQRAEIRRRYAETLLYFKVLDRTGLRQPATTIELETPAGEAPQLLITADYIEGENGFLAAAQADAAKIEKIVRACLMEVLKLVANMFTDRPVGYDSGLDNFVVQSDRGSAFCIDIFPPRLGFGLNAAGKPYPLPEEKLLINYPEGPQIKPEYLTRLRHFYYSATGTLEHFLAWSVTGYFARAENPLCWQQVKGQAEVVHLIDLILQQTLDAHFAKEADQLRLTLKTISFEDYLSYRLKRNWERLGGAQR